MLASGDLFEWQLTCETSKKAASSKHIFFINTLGQILVPPEFCQWLLRIMIWSLEDK